MLVVRGPWSVVRGFFDASAAWIGHEENGNGQHQPRYRGKVKRPVPTIILSDRAADQIAEREAKGQADHKDPHGPRAPFGRDQVADERAGSRGAACLADADSQAHHKQRPEIPGKAGAERQQAPERDARGQNPLSPPDVREPAQGQPDHGIQHDKRRAEPAEVAVGEVPLFFDLLLHGRQDLPVEEVHRVDGKQHQ